MLAAVIAFITCVGAILAGLIGINAQIPPNGTNGPLSQVVPYVSWLSLGLGVFGLLLLIIHPFRRALARLLVGLGIRLDPNSTPSMRRQAAQFHEGVDTLLTWVYRRKYWGPGLSTRARFSEGAPESYGQEVYDTLEIKRQYRRRKQALAEPDFDGTTLAGNEVVAETQDALGRMSAEGTRLLGEVNAPRLTRPDGTVPGEALRITLEERAEKWAGRCIDVLTWRLPHMAALFGSDAGRATNDYYGVLAEYVDVMWQHHLQTWMNVRLERLTELTKDADRYQGVLGSRPTWWETNPPDAIASGSDA